MLFAGYKLRNKSIVRKCLIRIKITINDYKISTGDFLLVFTYIGGGKLLSKWAFSEIIIPNIDFHLEWNTHRRWEIRSYLSHKVQLAIFFFANNNLLFIYPNLFLSFSLRAFYKDLSFYFSQLISAKSFLSQPSNCM